MRQLLMMLALTLLLSEAVVYHAFGGGDAPCQATHSVGWMVSNPIMDLDCDSPSGIHFYISNVPYGQTEGHYEY